MKTHEHFIEKCITLARKGILNVSPNPMVGCVIVYNDEIIGEGYHQEYGKSHAEEEEMASVEEKRNGGVFRSVQRVDAAWRKIRRV